MDTKGSVPTSGHDLKIQNPQTFRFIIESLSEGVAIADTTGQMVYFNPAAEKILGIGLMQSSPEEWQKIYGVFLEDMSTPFPESEYPLVKAIKGEIVTGVMQYIKNPHHETGMFIRVNGAPLKDDKGEIIGSVAIFSDITVERDIASHLQKKEEIEEKMNRLFIEREGVLESLKKENAELKAKLGATS